MPDIDYGEILEALNDKTDRDMQNLADAGKIQSSHLAMPSDVYENLTLPGNGVLLTAVADGYVFVIGNGQNPIQLDVVDGAETDPMNATSLLHGCASGNQDSVGSVCLPVRKGQKFMYFTDYDATKLRFCYAKGSESEKQN
ncbi:MAG: hypothetical protein II453_07190 [Alphaproteobacteria bacterium]|nr:hypothetical protein [Alphaproteobacteria bacterium]